MKKLEKEFNDLSKKYTNLEISYADNYSLISGWIGFATSVKKLEIKDKFYIHINIPKEYPKKLPIVRELKNRITKKFSHINDDLSLCLKAPIDLRIAFSEQQNLLGFVDNNIIPYLAGFCYWEKMGKMPFGERSHGGKGILEAYQELFNVKDEVIVLYFLKILADNNYEKNSVCPCGSKKKLCNCHGRKLLFLKNKQSLSDFKYDFQKILEYICFLICILHLAKKLINKNLFLFFLIFY